MNRIYVAGPMTGKHHLNFPAFDYAKRVLEAGGWVVITPADIARCDYGWGRVPPGTVTELHQDYSATTKDEKWDIILRDLVCLKTCDAIFLLHGWEQSKGATVEIALAELLGLDKYFAEDLYRHDDPNITDDMKISLDHVMDADDREKLKCN